MGFFDLFTNDVAKDAANDQILGINKGLTQATGNINQGIDALKTNYTAGLQPFLQNYATANTGVDQLKNLLGLNGPAGNQSALTSLENTPGYQFALKSGNDAVNAAAAANGTLASGKQLLDLSKYNQGLASTTYQNAVSNLQPFLGASQGAASGIAGVNTGLGNATAGQYDTLANLNWNAATGVGNANANATLAENQANQNIFNGLTSIASLGASLFSDERLKEDIAPVGELYDGQKVYSYRYKGSEIPHIGLMAQEVEKVAPDAVREVAGFKAVDYSKATSAAAQLARFLEAA
ncbi:tail fiber domain-containing protein [Bradyrhizobium oligotrophicum S58]